MPASRNARAMIFAPRSCPSRPGLATTTRIFFSVEVLITGTGRAECKRRSADVCARRTQPLERRRLAVGAEYGLQGSDHFAFGRFGAGGVEEKWHEVLVGAAGGLLQPG